MFIISSTFFVFRSHFGSRCTRHPFPFSFRVGAMFYGSLSVAALLMGSLSVAALLLMYLTAEKPTNLGLQVAHMPKMQQLYPTYPSFNMDKPQGRTVDINIGTNFSPMPKTQGNFLLLVDPLPAVCSHLSKQATADVDVAVLCCAVSNFTGSTTFKVYNRRGESSSLADTTKGTSHERFKPTSILTVVVLEASALLGGLVAKQNRIEKLKTDMQGFDLTALMNLRHVLSDKEQILQIKSECFFTSRTGKQIYHADNDCYKMKDYLTEVGYTAVIKGKGDVGDVYAYKPPATDFGDAKAFGN